MENDSFNGDQYLGDKEANHRGNFAFGQQNINRPALSISDNGLHQPQRGRPQEDVRMDDQKPLNEIPNNNFDDIGGF